MDADRLSRLTDKQRDCLRLVLMHRSSKEIARQLGIGADAVDQRVKTAMRTLGVDSRVEAARMLAEYEGTQPYQRFVYQPSDVVPPAAPAMFSPAAIDGNGTQGTQAGLAVREEQALFRALPWQTSGTLALPLPVEGKGRNELSAWQRAGWIVAIAIGTAIGFGAFLSGLEALGQLVNSGH
jgi:DNA-binding CsgD family transcriptional regulator